MEELSETTILIVNEEEQDTNRINKVLEKLGWNVMMASSGKEALWIILNKKIHLILMNDNLPDMRGIEVLEILRTTNRTKLLPVLFLSKDQKLIEGLQDELNEGYADCLNPDVDEVKLVARVSMLLRLDMLRKDLRRQDHKLEEYELLMNNSDDIICVVDADTLQIIKVNDSFCEVIGKEKRDLAGSPFLDLMSPEDQLKIRDLVPRTDERLFFESKMPGRNGEELLYSWKVICRNGLWLARAKNITSAREAEEIKNFLSVVVRDSYDAIYMYNPDDGNIISWNKGAERMYGYSEKEALDMYIWNIVPKHLMSETQLVIEKLLRGKEVKAIETKRITKFGKIVDVLFSASVIKDPQGQLRSVAITEKDITSQKTAEKEVKELNDNLRHNLAQLELSNKELESFALTVSHDLRAPLYFIKNFVKMIREEYEHRLDPKLYQLIINIGRNTVHMQHMVEDLLEFSRSGRSNIEKQLIDFNQMVKEVVEQVKPFSSKCEVEIKELNSAMGDETLLFQVFANLISNAIKYSGKKKRPKVIIGSEQKEEEVVFYVHDNGDGFHEKDAGKLFEIFQRLHNQEDFEGTGVGLAIVKRIVVRHGGRVWANGKKGHFATFYFSLPVEIREGDYKSKKSSDLSPLGPLTEN